MGVLLEAIIFMVFIWRYIWKYILRESILLLCSEAVSNHFMLRIVKREDEFASQKSEFICPIRLQSS